jgi:hypothetical protein
MSSVCKSFAWLAPVAPGPGPWKMPHCKAEMAGFRHGPAFKDGASTELVL